MQADKSHLHHKLLELGYTHRQTVLLIYSIAILFSLSSIILYLSQPLGALMMFILIILTIELIVEFTGLIDDNYRPILNLITKKVIIHILNINMKRKTITKYHKSYLKQSLDFIVI